MRSGFTFKNRHSSEFGITLRTKSRQLLPEVRTSFYDTPLADGSYDFSESNPFGREFYNDRIFELEMRITAGCLAELEQKCARIAAWLRGRGELIFDSAAGVKWSGRFVSDTAFTPERRGKTALLTAMFRTSPSGSAVFNTTDGVLLGGGVVLESDIPLDMTEYFEIPLPYGESAVRAVNIGDFYVRPVFEFDGTAENISVRLGDSKIYLENIIGDTKTIDCKKCTVTAVNSDGEENGMSCMRGEFFELPPGVSELTVYVSEPCIMRIRYTPQTIYDFDFSHIDWGEEDA